ncbi:hypothetical protein FKW77_005647 [Venturia effusa]|uniref:Uncharacterized protein n=1 Tax=Venturia effusa TaxID=50376 RepID=A0A517LQA1_9PEZI|nr:hypothetical protein FKW77_005647 [Venturia effusa]
MDRDGQLALPPKKRSCPPAEQGPPKRYFHTFDPSHLHPSSSPFSLSSQSSASSTSDRISSQDDPTIHSVLPGSLDHHGHLLNCDQLGNLSAQYKPVDSQTTPSDWNASESHQHDLEEEEVCFGMLCNVAVRLRTEESRQAVNNICDTNIQVGKRRFRRLLFKFQHGRCDLVTPDEEKVAVLNMASFRALEKLTTDFSVLLDGLIELANDNYRRSHSAKETEHARDAKLDIVICGRRRFANSVAELLCQADHFLEDPYWNPGPLPYENPQDLELSGLPLREQVLVREDEAFESADSSNGLVPDLVHPKTVNGKPVSHSMALQMFVGAS